MQAASVGLRKVRDLEDKPGVVTLELDLESWPTQQVRFGPDGWTREAVLAEDG